MESFRLVSVNIEGGWHRDRVRSFLRKMTPDVVCLQEVCRRDVAIFSKLLEADAHFAPMCNYPTEADEIGVAIISRLPMTTKTHCVAGCDSEELPTLDSKSYGASVPTQRTVLVVAEVLLGDKKFVVSTTHLPVTHKGVVTTFQMDVVQRLLDVVSSYPDLILTGDLNAPRGREAFDLIASRYHDNVPSHYTSSIDGGLHRAGVIDLMVDGLFSTPGYVVSEVELHTGVSDHCALSAEVSHGV